MKVSIIVPVYNTGAYLSDCIRSICAQTHTDLQIVMVDDGSEPVTARLCDELASADPRITLIHKANEGVSIARNAGLAVASGDLIGFVDSDDTIQPGMIERLVSALEQNNADIAMCDATTITPGRPDEPDTIPLLKESCVLERKDITPAMLTLLAGSAWRCVYRRTDMLAEQAKFPTGIKFSEDRIFNIIAMGLARRIAYVKESYYNRLIRMGSACFRFYPDMTSQLEKMRVKLLDAVRNYWGNNYIPAYEQQIAAQILFVVTNFTSLYNGMPFRQQSVAIKSHCQSAELQECMFNSGRSDFRSWLYLKCHYRLLALTGLLTNIYHRICHKGLYQR